MGLAVGFGVAVGFVLLVGLAVLVGCSVGLCVGCAVGVGVGVGSGSVATNQFWVYPYATADTTTTVMRNTAAMVIGFIYTSQYYVFKIL